MPKLALFATGLAALAGCSDSCGNTVIDRADAPDGLHSAWLFERNCGATTGFSTQVSVLDAGAELSGSGNAFVADNGEGTAVEGDWGAPWAELSWIGNNHLLIRYAAGSRMFEQGRQVSGVRISYRQVQNGAPPASSRR